MTAIRPLRSLLVVALLAPGLAGVPAWQAHASRVTESPAVQPSDDPPFSLDHAVSPPVRSLPFTVPGTKPHQMRLRGRPLGPVAVRPPGLGPDPVVQRRDHAGPTIPLTANFEGIPSDDDYPPPDPNASVSSTQVLEVVNFRFGIFSKTGAVLRAPTDTNALFANLPGLCATHNDGDAVVRWDAPAGRWLLTQFALDSPNREWRECVAVSRGPDATGQWDTYDFGYRASIDYPKVGLWPDAYYVTYNLDQLHHAKVCAWDRAAMLAGAPRVRQQCFDAQTPPQGRFGGILLPADLDGRIPPPRGEPNTLVGLGPSHDTLNYWRFHVDWADRRRSVFAGPYLVRVAPYTPACEGTDPENCVPQRDTGQKLDSLSYWMMQRSAYRNFGDHQSLVVNHAVDAPGGVGVRWYELRMRHGRPAVHQQSTYAPNGTYRWMASIAQDRSGGIALGYSQSSARSHPSILITGRRAGDPRGLMTLGETPVQTGGGSQSGGQYAFRWGDYTSMVIDPRDDCTFWYTNEYLPQDGYKVWHTRIAAFRLPGCGARPPRVPPRWAAGR